MGTFMATSTPGPWRVGERNNGGQIEIRAGGGLTLIGWANARPSLVRINPEANARLMAAAPVLFEALQVIASRANGAQLQPERTALLNACMEINEWAREALALATGEGQ